LGGGANRSIFGYMDEIQNKYEEISAALPYGFRLMDEDFVTQLGKIERDIEQISSTEEFALSEEERIQRSQIEKNTIYGVNNVC